MFGSPSPTARAHWASRGDVIVLPYGDQHWVGGQEHAEPVPIVTPVAAVARRVGYDSEEAFSRAFKRSHGAGAGRVAGGSPVGRP